ncbi:hypothetical protein SAMN02927903_03238 [Flavobacterium caeni]|uniref:Immunity protein 43 n=2 Tax=Flavobacterium caeni TaxID=490189 RepID=A0A1G5KCM2_9FLAO|nr:hypothetical protein SAMN02927903_03238 [Flavobacterium caeni]
MKKYYVLEVSDESAAEFPDGYNYNDKHSSSALRSYIHENRDFPSFIPKLSQTIYDDPEFNKLNDFIFGPIEKFCVSRRVKEVLEQFNLPKHKFYPVDVFMPTKFLGIIKTQKKVNAQYFAFNFDFFYITNNEHWINYEKTELKKDHLGINQTEHIFLNKNFDKSLDFFELRYSWMTYVSEELMNKLIEIGATGLMFSEINERQYKVKRPNPKITWE